MEYNQNDIRREPSSSSAYDITRHSLDSLASELYNNWNDVKKEFRIDRYIVQPVKKAYMAAYEYTADSLRKSKDINKDLLIALGVSVVSNFVFTKFARSIPGIDSSELHRFSYLAEMVPGTTAFAITYSIQKRREGVSWKNIREELIRIGMTGGSIGFGPYQWIRGPTMDWMESTGIPKDIVPLATQALLFVPVTLAIDMVGKPMKYLHDNRHRINKRIKRIAIQSTNNIIDFNYGRKKDKS